MADQLGPPREGEPDDAEAHAPSPTIWPFGFAAGVALVLVGLILSWTVVAIGIVLAVVFAFLWVREVYRESVEPSAPTVEEEEEEKEVVIVEEEATGRYPRSKFLEGATLGLGGLIGGIVTLPAVGFAVATSFVGQDYPEVDLGPLDNFPEGQFVIVNFEYREGAGQVARRTAYVRNNGSTRAGPSFTILSNRCVHLGCPVQPQGPSGERTDVETETGRIELTPTQPSGFGCPCHGGAYDEEGNRTAGPPVRSLDRYRYLIRDGRLVLTEPYSVADVAGTGAEARIEAYPLADPGVHVEGPEKYLYPIVP